MANEYKKSGTASLLGGIGLFLFLIPIALVIFLPIASIKYPGDRLIDGEGIMVGISSIILGLLFIGFAKIVDSCAESAHHLRIINK